MSQFSLHILQNGQLQTLPINLGETITLSAQENTLYQIVDESGQVLSESLSEVVQNDLVLQLGENTNLVIQDYALYYPQQTLAAGAAESGTVLNLGEATLASEVAATTATTTTAAATTATATLGSLSTVAIASATVGSALAMAGAVKNSSKGSSEATQNPQGEQGSQEDQKVDEKDASDLSPKILIDPIDHDDIINSLTLIQDGKEVTVLMISGKVINGDANLLAKAGDVVTLTVGEGGFSGRLNEENGELLFSIAVDTKNLLTHQSISATVMTQDDKGIAKAYEVHRSYTVDLELNQPTISVEKLNENRNIINKADAAAEKTVLSGSVGNLDSDVKSVEVEVDIGGEKVPAIYDAQSKTWSVSVDTAKLIALADNDVERTVTAYVKVADAAGNTQSNQQSYTFNVDTQLNEPKLTSIEVTSENIIDKEEAKAENSTVTFELELDKDVSTDYVVIKTDLSDKTAMFDATDKKWRLNLPTEKLLALPDNENGKKALELKISVQDDAGNHIEVIKTHLFGINSMVKPVISIDNITKDNVINKQESKGDVEITGQITNGYEGQEVFVSCPCSSCTSKWLTKQTVLGADGKFSIIFNGVDLVNSKNKDNNSEIKVEYTAKDEAGNTSAADEAKKSFSVDIEAPNGVIKLDAVTGDGIINTAEAAQATIKVSGGVGNLENGAKLVSLRLFIGDHIIENSDIKYLGSRFEAEVPAAYFRGNDKVRAEALVSDRYGNEATITTSDEADATSKNMAYRYDEQAPDIAIAVNPINQDNKINLAQLIEDIEISGTLTFDEADVKAESIVVTVNIGDKVYAAEVKGKTWSLNVPAKVLAAFDAKMVTAKVEATDEAGNPTTQIAEKNYTVDIEPPSIEIALDPIPNVQSGSTGTTTISGTVKGEFRVGEKVKLVLNNQTEEVEITAGGQFSKEISNALLEAAPATSIVASYETEDEAKNPATTQTSGSYKVVTGDIDIVLNSITADNHLNVTEAQKAAIDITGTISGTSASETSSVKLIVNGKEISAEVDASLNFKASIAGDDLAKNAGYTVQAVVSGSNNATAKTAQAYTVSPDVAATVNVDHVGDNFTANLSKSTRIKGVIEFDGAYAVGKNNYQVKYINLKIGEKTYSVGFNSKEKSFFVDIDNDELAGLNGQKISVDFTNPSTSDLKQEMFAYRIVPGGLDPATQKPRDYAIRTINELPTVKTLTLTTSDNNLSITKGEGNSYTVNKPSADKVVISGSVSGSAKVDDVIEVSVGEKTYTTKVTAENKFSVEVLANDLQNGDSKVTALLKTHDLSGREIAVSDVEFYAQPKAVSEAFVNRHERVQNQNIDHTSPDYNFAYFIHQIAQDPNVTPADPMGETKVIKYQFIDADEIAAKNIPVQGSRYVVPDSYLNFNSSHQDTLRTVYNNISDFINVRFEEVSTSDRILKIGEGTRLFRAKLTNGFGGASAFAFANGDLIWNDLAPHQSGDGKNAFTSYTALHEITHTLEMAHSKVDSTGKPKPNMEMEENTEFTNMSYNYNSFIDYRSLRMFDLAFLHYRFGVNRTKRTGNDTYTFKDYNNVSADGGLYIWDGGGVDTFDASAEGEGVYVNLTPGSWIYRGSELSKYFAVKGSENFTRAEFFDMPEDTKFYTNFSGIDVIVNTWYANKNIIHYNAEYTKGQAFIGYGTQIENLIGTAHNDILIGNKADNNIQGGAGDDVIKGGEGNDYLDGGAGKDTMYGEAGDDIYVVDNAEDKVIEVENEGTDTVLSLVNHTLGEHVENLQLLGTTATEATGNALANTLIANNVGNSLNGMGGNDRLIGGLGADTLTGGDGEDVFVFETALNGKVDTITDFNVAQDKIELSSKIFTVLTPEMNNITDYIKYDATSGHLSYDSDAAGTTDAIHFATITPSGLTDDSADIRYEVV